jgi:4-aminobutyrate aminotransferase-like enzyme
VSAIRGCRSTLTRPPSSSGRSSVPRIRELGLICRVDARDAPVVQLAPPLVADRAVLTEMLEIVDTVLAEAGDRMWR